MLVTTNFESPLATSALSQRFKGKVAMKPSLEISSTACGVEMMGMVLSRFFCTSVSK